MEAVRAEAFLCESPEFRGGKRPELKSVAKRALFTAEPIGQEVVEVTALFAEMGHQAQSPARVSRSCEIDPAMKTPPPAPHKGQFHRYNVQTNSWDRFVSPQRPDGSPASTPKSAKALQFDDPPQ